MDNFVNGIFCHSLPIPSDHLTEDIDYLLEQLTEGCPKPLNTFARWLRCSHTQDQPFCDTSEESKSKSESPRSK
jgi:hypothetical protein